MRILPCIEPRRRVVAVIGSVVNAPDSAPSGPPAQAVCTCPVDKLRQIRYKASPWPARKSFTALPPCCILHNLRRGDREAEGARLEIVCTARYRGFESLPLRQLHFSLRQDRRLLPTEVTAGSRATDGREPRQARKGAAAVAPVVCRGGAWLSLVPAIFSGTPDVPYPF